MSYANPKLDKLMEEARSTVDEAKRMPLWQQCHRIIHEDQPYTFLFNSKALVFLDKPHPQRPGIEAGAQLRSHRYHARAMGMSPRRSRNGAGELIWRVTFIRRLLLMVPTLLGMTLVVFFVMALSPGGIGASLLTSESGMRPEERKALLDYYNTRYGLNKPLPVQYLRWLNKVSPVGIKPAGDGWPRNWHVGVKVPDLGESFARQRPVLSLIKEALPITLLLNAISIPLAYSISILIGIKAARHRGKLLDVGSGTVLLGLWSVPTIWAGVLCIGFLASRDYLKLFPTNGLPRCDLQRQHAVSPGLHAGGVRARLAAGYAVAPGVAGRLSQLWPASHFSPSCRAGRCSNASRRTTCARPAPRG